MVEIMQVVILEDPVQNWNIYLVEENNEHPTWRMHYDHKHGYQGPIPLNPSATPKGVVDRVLRNAFLEWRTEQGI